MALAEHPTPGYLGAGCTEACSRQRVRPYAFLHDAASHEDYGYRQALASLCPPTVRTGILTIRFIDHTVLVTGGRDMKPSPNEWRILELLASKVGKVVSRSEIVAHMDPTGGMSSTPRPAAHSLRVTITRIRSRLGEAASLLQTVYGTGHMLADVPVGEVLAVVPPGNRFTGRWATHYDQCIDCGRSDRAHNSHGRCSRCAKRRDRTEVEG